MEGIERIKKLSQEQKDNNIKKVAEYLITREDMDEKYLNEDKNLIDMWEYIRNQAREKSENGCAVMDDDEVYGLAIHYFDETNENLNFKCSTNKLNRQKEKQAEKATSKEISKNESVTKQEENPKKVDNEEKQPVKTEEKEVEDVPAHKDDDIVMKYKGKAVTYKEFRAGTYLQLS